MKCEKIQNFPVVDNVEWFEDFEFGISKEWGCIVSKKGSQTNTNTNISTVIIKGIEEISENRIAVDAINISNCQLWNWHNDEFLRKAVLQGKLTIIPVAFRAITLDSENNELISLIWVDSANVYKELYTFGEAFKINEEIIFTDFIDIRGNSITYQDVTYTYKDNIKLSDESNRIIAEAVCDLLLADNRDEYLMKINPLDKTFIRSIRDDSDDIIMNDYFAVVRFQPEEDDGYFYPEEKGKIVYAYALHFIHKDGKRGTYLYTHGENPEPVRWVEYVYHIMKERIGS